MDKQRSIKALTENIIMNVRSDTSSWIYTEKHGNRAALSGAVSSILSSLTSSSWHASDDYYTSVILKAITEAIRIARMYDDLDAADIIKAVEDAATVLGKDFN